MIANQFVQRFPHLSCVFFMKHNQEITLISWGINFEWNNHFQLNLYRDLSMPCFPHPSNCLSVLTVVCSCLSRKLILQKQNLIIRFNSFNQFSENNYNPKWITANLYHAAPDWLETNQCNEDYGDSLQFASWRMSFTSIWTLRYRIDIIAYRLFENWAKIENDLGWPDSDF